jgi:hypothetical protein
MRQITARQLLDGWEALGGQPMPVRGGALAALATGQPLSDVMCWSIARRDLALFDLRAQVFGDSIEAVISCPQCAERLEMALQLADIRPHKHAATLLKSKVLRVDGKRVRYRAPNGEDLLAIAGARDATAARAQLLERCIQADEPALRERTAALLAGEPTDVQLRLTCPACGHIWQSPFDIAAFFWRELDEWARRTLREIHVIAGAYGWSEDEILLLSARRRQTYVEMIR